MYIIMIRWAITVVLNTVHYNNLALENIITKELGTVLVKVEGDLISAHKCEVKVG
jgi:hypothetical protein